MATRILDTFSTIKTEGAILPAELLRRVADGDSDVPGLTPESYHLAKTERINEAATRAWNRIQGAWESFRTASEKLPKSDTGTTLTRERWLLILFQELGYGRLTTQRAVEIEGRTYPISHLWQQAPIHLVSFRQELGRRTPGVRGAARVSPHSMVQEFLNRSDDHLWGFVSNGLHLWILRDNVSLTRAAYVEFDLQAMMDGEVYSDFFLLYLLCHQSRVEVPEGKTPEHCWLEKWYNTAAQQGVRALDQLRQGVQNAIEALAGGFLAYPGSTQLRDRLRSGQLTTQDYYRQVLRQVYRLLFLFVAEDRGLLFDPESAAKTQQIYTNHYSTQRLRTLAQKRRGTRHPDLFQLLRLVFDKLRTGCRELALPALGSFLFSKEATADLNEADIANCDLLAAFRRLAFTVDRNVLRPINYRNLGSEELGSVYESLLEMHPEINLEAATFALNVAAGSERKTTGSYYTPTSLVNCLLESALDPVLDEACKKDDPEKALLDLKICDPACGSGHFLIAAAHRVAKRLASIRAGEEEPAPESVNKALRDVIGRCIYGVDINPMAVELCKVNLWIEALEPGKPLSFLDHHIQCGNSLLGTTPALLEKGIPDEAFKPIEGDVKAIVNEYKKRNKAEGRAARGARGQTAFWADEEGFKIELGNMPQMLASLDEAEDDTIEKVRAQEERYTQAVSSVPYLNAKFLCDVWCGAFVWRKDRRDTQNWDAITEETFRNIQRNPHSVVPWIREEIIRLCQHYRFVHWHLAFPQVFRVPRRKDFSVEELDRNRGAMPCENPQTGWNGGFDVVLGNPPWERIKLQEKEWFAARDPEIANAPNAAARRRMIAALEQNNPSLYRAFLEDRRRAEGESHLVRDSDRYPLGGRGDVNTYTIFAELKRSLLNATGHVGCIVPSGIATDDTTKFFFQDLMDKKSLVSLYDFENRNGIFPGVHRSYKFCLLTLSGSDRPAQVGTDLVFFAHDVADLTEEDRHFTLTSNEIALLNPNTRTCPIFRSKRDAELTKAVYRRVPVIIREARDGQPEDNPWGITFLRMFDMANDSHLFHTREQLEADDWRPDGNIFRQGEKEYLPLYEAKMGQMFDHRAASVVLSETAMVRQGQPERFDASDHSDPHKLPTPRYWVDDREVSKRLNGNRPDVLLGFTDVTSPTNERSMLASIIPPVGVGHTMPLIMSELSTLTCSQLEANLNAFCLDYLGRQKLGGIHYTFFILKQLPMLPPERYAKTCQWMGTSTNDWILPRLLELTYTAWDLTGFAADCEYKGPPFIWDEKRRFLIRCELDATYFHLYLGSAEEWKEQSLGELLPYFPTPRHAVDYVMETFPIVKRKDEKAHGEYRTKRVILEIYDAMADAIRTGKPYQTILNPPPGPPCDGQGNFLPLPDWQPGQPKPSNWPPHIHPPRHA